MRSTSSAATLEYSVVFDGTVVHILDRRVFPAREVWLTARTPLEVAQAITGMVTQSSGPLYAACAGMKLAAVQVAELPLDAAQATLSAAAQALGNARPTNAHPRDAVARILGAATSASNTSELVELVTSIAEQVELDYREAGLRIGRAAVSLLPRHATVLTHCWAEAYLFGVVAAARESGRTINWITTETRPYLQGARLTAHSLRELGQRVTLITDGMAAAALASVNGAGSGPVDAVITAADRVSMDGCVVNKVGTLGVAVAAAAFDIPYYGLVEAPDPSTSKGDDIIIETREPNEVFEVLQRRTASTLVTEAWYPAFDLTPAKYVTKIATSRGVYAPTDITKHFTTNPDALASPLTDTQETA
ncbi:MAG: hypothetical protein ACTHW3_02735 [Leucobacter sp.]